jgi:hypothetical protein
LVAFVWRNLDVFVAMQSFLKAHKPMQRPSYKEVSKSLCSKRFPHVFKESCTKDIAALRERNSKVKKGSLPAPFGAWTLDFASTYDWRNCGNAEPNYKDFVLLSRIELFIVGSYRSDLFQNCPAAAHLRHSISSLLNCCCKPVPCAITNTKTTRPESVLRSKFFFPDKITAPQVAEAHINTIDVVELKSKDRILDRTQGLLVEASDLMKKLEQSEALCAFPGSKEIDASIHAACATLNDVCIYYILLFFYTYTDTYICFAR